MAVDTHHAAARTVDRGGARAEGGRCGARVFGAQRG